MDGFQHFVSSFLRGPWERGAGFFSTLCKNVILSVVRGQTLESFPWKGPILLSCISSQLKGNRALMSPHLFWKVSPQWSSSKNATPVSWAFASWDLEYLITPASFRDIFTQKEKLRCLLLFCIVSKQLDSSGKQTKLHLKLKMFHEHCHNSTHCS